MVINTLTIPGINRYTGDLEVEKRKIDSISHDLLKCEIQKFISSLQLSMDVSLYIQSDRCYYEEVANVSNGSVDYMLYDTPTKKGYKFTLTKSMAGSIGTANISNAHFL